MKQLIKSPIVSTLPMLVLFAKKSKDVVYVIRFN